MVKSAISFFDPIGHAPNQLPTTSPMGLKNELADTTMTMTGVHYQPYDDKKSQLQVF